jgi:hypothetical protein
MADTSTPYLQALLGETPDRYQLQTVDATRELMLRMVVQAGRSLDLLSADLEPALYNQPAFLEAFKRLALKHKAVRIRILLQDNNLVRNQGHRLIDLIQRLPSVVELRKPDQAFREFPENFLLVDACGYLHRKLQGRYQVSACFNDRHQVSLFEELFTQAWETGEPDRELARLDL